MKFLGRNQGDETLEPTFTLEIGFTSRVGSRPIGQDSPDGANKCNRYGAGGSPKQWERTLTPRKGIWLLCVHRPFLHLLATCRICSGRVCTTLSFARRLGRWRNQPEPSKTSPSDTLSRESGHGPEEDWKPLEGPLYRQEPPDTALLWFPRLGMAGASSRGS